MRDVCGFRTTSSWVLTLKRALHQFVAGLVVLWADVVASPAQQVQALSAPRARIAVHAGLAVCRALCKDNRAEACLSSWKQNPTQKNKNKRIGVLTGRAFPLSFVADKSLRAGLLAFAQVEEEPCSASRAEVLGEAGVTLWPALLTKKHRPTASVYLNHKLSSASCVLNTHCVTVLHVSLGKQLRVLIDALHTYTLDLI